MKDSPKTRVLFVCLGNICRSPSAEAVFKSVVDGEGLSNQFEIDSCGTGGGSANWYLPMGFSYHEGECADSRMQKAAAERGIRLTSRSRPLRPADLDNFDYIIGMDNSNLANIREAAEHWLKEGRHPNIPRDYAKKLSLLTQFLLDSHFKQRYDSVPDPYYGGPQGFQVVLDLLLDACQGLLREIQKKKETPRPL
eukprot:GGOE01021849.1.p1 GENE.GGOE01021849.1~~GGOE01021849.1.p1  ORF type:complete len:208 (+),score=40.66 GGOE01021849.1:42-626(+)